MVLTLIFAMLWGGGWADGWKDPRYSLTVQEVVTVPRGLCVLVPCSFSYPRDDWNDQTPAYGYWFIHGTKTNEGRPVATNNLSREVESGAKNRFYLVGNPQENSCTLKIDDPQIRDSRAYHFRIERGKSVRYNFVDNKFYLNVTARTQKPAVYVPETLEPGQQVTAICVFHLDFQQCQAPIFFWTGAAPPSHRISLTSARVSVLTFTPSSEDHGASLTCHVYFPGHHMNFENSVQLNVAYAPKVPVISIFQDNRPVPMLQGDSQSLTVRKGQFLRLLCEADSSPPATLSWALEDRVLSWSHLSGSGHLQLVLPGAKPEDVGRYTCRGENRLGFQSRSLNLSVQYAPQNLTVMVSRADGTVPENLRNGASLPILEGESLRLLCVAHSNPAARLSWARSGEFLSPSQSPAPGVLELPRIQMEHEGEFICEASNVLGSLQVSLHLSVRYPPKLLGHSCSWEDEGLRCSCSSRAQPAPSLRWRLGEALLEENNSNDSYRVTSSFAGPWANSSLSLRVGLSAGLRLSCEVGNVHGAQSAAVLLLPEKKELISKGFSSGVLLGTGVTALFILCLILVFVKVLRKKQTQAGTLTQAGTPAQAGTSAQAGTPAQAETRRPRVTRRSTILDYINVVPNSGHLARNRRAKHSSPSRTPPADANSPRPKSSHPAPESGSNEEEIHYAALRFSGLRAQETQDSRDIGAEYAEIRFH